MGRGGEEREREEKGQEERRGEGGEGKERGGKEEKGKGRKERRGDRKEGEGPLDYVFPVAFITPVRHCVRPKLYLVFRFGILLHCYKVTPYSLTSDLENLFSNVHSHLEYFAKFHYNPSTKYGDIASRETVLMGNGRPVSPPTVDGEAVKNYVLAL